MQRILSDKSRLPIFHDIEGLYRYTSDKPSESTQTIHIDKCYRRLFHLFSEYGGYDYPVEYEKKYYRPVSVEPVENTVILCFSGGKDSVSAALWYKEHGYSVYLYHLKGINQTYKDEWKSASKLADLLELPIEIDELSLSGQHDYTEHPMKNMIIANAALQYALNNQLGYRIAFGNYKTSSIKTDPFDVCAGDDPEMWEAYESIIHRVIPDFRIDLVLDSMYDSLETLSENKKLIPHIKSCIGPYRYREYLHKNNCTKYDIKLLPHRCGSCWKDAVEYIFLADKGLLKYNKGFYEHSLRVLKKSAEVEDGIIHKNLLSVYRAYFSNTEKSPYFREQEENG